MPAPLGKPTKFEGGRRPWNVAMEQPRKAPETELAALERETCLACPLPECSHYSLACGLKGISLTRDELPVPDDLAALSEAMTVAQLAEHYGTSQYAVRKWRAKAGLTGVRIKAPPENFRYYGRTETLRQLAARYGVSRKTAAKWRVELGISPDTKE